MSPNSKNAGLDLLVRIGVLFALMLFLFPAAKGASATAGSRKETAPSQTFAKQVDFTGHRNGAASRKINVFNGLDPQNDRQMRSGHASITGR